MSKYIVIDEPNTECDWDTFIAAPEFAEQCFNIGTKCIVDTKDRYDHHYPEGFHWAHLCDKHIDRAYTSTLEWEQKNAI